MSLLSDIKAKIAKLVINMNRFDTIMNADATTDVPVDVGVIPSLRKVLAQLTNDPNAFANTPVSTVDWLSPRSVRDLLKDYNTITDSDVNSYADNSKAAANRLVFQKSIDDCQARNRKLIIKTRGPYACLDAPIVAKVGRSSGTVYHFHMESEYSCRSGLAAQFDGYALEILPVCDLANAGTGDASLGDLRLRGLDFNCGWINTGSILVPAITTGGVVTTPAAYASGKAFRIGRAGKTWVPFMRHDAIQDISAAYGSGSHVYKLEGGVANIAIRNLCGYGVTSSNQNSAAGILFECTTSGGYIGEIDMYGCRFMGHGNAPPIDIYVVAANNVAAASVAAIHTYSTWLYGAGSRAQAIGSASVGDFYMHGLQIDQHRYGSDGYPTGDYEIPAMYLYTQGQGRMLNINMYNPYVTNFYGPAVKVVTDQVGADRIGCRNINIKGGQFASLNRTKNGSKVGRGVIDVIGSTGVHVSDVSFQACTAQSYLIAAPAGAGNGAYDISFNANNTDTDPVNSAIDGRYDNVVDYIATFDQCDRYISRNNIMRTKTGLVTETRVPSGAIRDITTGNVRY